MNTLIISPTYNEKKNITSLVDSIFNINKEVSFNFNLSYLDDIYRKNFFVFSGEIRALL